jgi:hypothetical protein
MVTAKVRQLVRAVNRANDLRWRQPPPIRVGADDGRTPTVYHLCPDLATASGGVRNIYRHVDALNTVGVAAAVLHSRPGFRCGWFANQTRVVAARDVTMTSVDVLVVPECYSPWLHRLPTGPRKVIFNQGAYHTFDLIPFAGTAPGAPYAGVADLAALLTVSEDSEALLRHAFPTVPVHRARLVIDGTVFHPQPGPGARRIAYLLNRRAAEREQVLHILRSRGVLDGWELVPIHNRTEAETAEMMRGCGLFLSFSDRDGFGLPPAEAMASGCYVVGYTGLGGREFFDPDHCSPVPENDLLAYARAAEAAITAFEQDPDRLAKLGRLASERVLHRYTHDGLRDDLLSFYGPILAG